MPREYQKSVSIPDRVYQRAVKYFNEHEEELKNLNITSVTALINYWILQASKES